MIDAIEMISLLLNLLYPINGYNEHNTTELLKYDKFVNRYIRVLPYLVRLKALHTVNTIDSPGEFKTSIELSPYDGHCETLSFYHSILESEAYIRLRIQDYKISTIEIRVSLYKENHHTIKCRFNITNNSFVVRLHGNQRITTGESGDLIILEGTRIIDKNSTRYNRIIIDMCIAVANLTDDFTVLRDFLISNLNLENYGLSSD